MERELQAITFDNPLLIPLYDCQIDKVEQRVETAKRLGKLSANSNLNKQLQQRKLQSEQYVINIDNYILKKARQLYAENHTIQAADYIERALQYNRFNEEGVLLKIDYLINHVSLDSAALYLGDLLPDYHYHPAVIREANRIYLFFMQRVVRLINETKYSEAMETYIHMIAFAEASDVLTRTSEAERIYLQQIHEGLYVSMCDVAEKAYAVQRLKLAETYGIRAWDYYDNNKKNLKSNLRACNLLQKIVNDYDGNRLRAADVEESLFYKIRLDQIRVKTGIRVETPLLSAQTLPSSTVSEGKPTQQPIRKQPPILNPQPFKIEVTIEPSKPVSKPNGLANAGHDKLETRNLKSETLVFTSGQIDTAKILLEQILRKAEYNLWLRDYKRADTLYKQAKQIADLYAINREMDVLSSFGNYEIERTKYHCLDFQNKIEDYYIAAKNMQRNGNYADARNRLNESYLLIKQQNACHPNVEKLDKMRDEIKIPADYQDLIQTGNAAFENGDTLQFFVSYLDAEKIYSYKQLDSLQIRKTTLYDKLNYERNIPLIMWACEYFIQYSEYQEAQRYLNILDHFGYADKRTKALHKFLKKQLK